MEEGGESLVEEGGADAFTRVERERGEKNGRR